jgi:hypothetical protein
VAVALPYARARGVWAAALLAAFFIAAQLLAAPALAPAAIVLVGWLICLGVAVEPHVRARLSREPDPRSVETLATVRELRPAGG